MFRAMLSIGTTLAGFFLSAVALAQTPAVPAMTADEIVERNAAARGGLQAWRAVQSMSMRGTMDAGHDMTLPYSLELKRPRLLRLELEFQGNTAVQVYDGTHGWKFRPFLGKRVVEEMSPLELRAAASETPLDGALIDYAAKGYRLELLGSDTVETKPAYKLKVTMPGKIVRNVWVDAGSFLEVKVDGTRRMDGKDRVMEVYLRDYRPEGGLLIPHVLETAIDGVKARHRLVVQNVTVNPTLAESRFARP